MLYMNFNPTTHFSDELLLSQRRQYTGNIKYYYTNHICGIDELILSYVGVYEWLQAQSTKWILWNKSQTVD